MSAYEIIMICLSFMNLLLKLLKVFKMIKSKKHREAMRKAAAYSQYAVAL